MILPKMSLKRVPAIKDFRALIYLTLLTGLVASPSFKLVMLGILVAFPVVFTPKSFGTCGICAAVRTVMTFLMFPGYDY